MGECARPFTRSPSSTARTRPGTSSASTITPTSSTRVPGMPTRCADASATVAVGDPTAPLRNAPREPILSEGKALSLDALALDVDTAKPMVCASATLATLVPGARSRAPSPCKFVHLRRVNDFAKIDCAHITTYI